MRAWTEATSPTSSGRPIAAALPPTEARRFLNGLDALDGHVPETYRRLIVERIYETLQTLDP